MNFIYYVRDLVKIQFSKQRVYYKLDHDTEHYMKY